MYLKKYNNSNIKESENNGYVSKKKNNNQEEKLTKAGINWDNPNYGKPLANLYK